MLSLNNCSYDSEENECIKKMVKKRKVAFKKNVRVLASKFSPHEVYDSNNESIMSMTKKIKKRYNNFSWN